MYLCFYTYPKTKVEQSQSNTISFYLLIVRKSTIVYFSACELLHNCYMVVFLFTQTQNLNNHIVMPFLVILRLPRSEQQVFFHSPSTVPTLLYGCLSAYPNTKIGLSECYHIFYSVVSINTITQK